MPNDRPTPAPTAALPTRIASSNGGLLERAGPAWTERLDANRLRSAFDSSALTLTVGAEEELLLVGAHGNQLSAAGGDVLQALGGDDRYRAEFRRTQIEIVTRPCLSAADVGRELAQARVDLAEATAGRTRLVSCGTHPTARSAGPISEGDRYRIVAEDNPWAALHMLTCGLHVHVAIGGAERALGVYNAMRSYLPELAALAANSPFHHAADSGCASSRMHLNRALARHGVPPAFRDWNEYADFVAWGRAGRSIPDPSYHWWDLRLHPGFGTIELRVCDAQTELADTVALVGLVQTLAAWLAGRFDADDLPRAHDTHRIAESLWIAARHGSAGSILDLGSGRRVSTRTRVRQLIDELAPLTVELGTERELARVSLLARSCGADRQREVAKRHGVDDLVDWLASRTVASARSYLISAGVTNVHAS